MSDTGRIHGTAVVLGKGGELLIDDRLIAVAPGDGRLKIVCNDCGGHTLEVLEGVLAGLDQVLFFLRPYSLTVCISG